MFGNVHPLFLWLVAISFICSGFVMLLLNYRATSDKDYRFTGLWFGIMVVAIVFVAFGGWMILRQLNIEII